MSSKRDKFYALCRKLWTAGTFVFAASAIFIAGSNYAPVAHAQWNGNDTHVFPGGTSNVPSDDPLNPTKEAATLLVDGTLTISSGGTVAASKNVILGTQAAGTINVQNGGLLEVGAAAYPGENSVPGFAGSRLTVSSGGGLTLDDGTSFDNAARILLDGNVAITGTGKTAKTASLGSYGLIDGTGQEARTDLGYYTLSDAVTGTGSVSISSAGVEMGESSAILGGTSGITISNSSISGSKTATDGFYIAGNQTIETSGAMTITGSDFTLGDQVILRSGGELSFSNSTLDSGTYYVLGSGNINVTGSTLTLTGEGGSIASEKNVNISGNSTIVQGNSGKISGTEVTVNNSTLTQENYGSIEGKTNLTINNNVTVSQENSGTISVVGTANGSATLDITSSATVTQGNDGTISIGGSGLAGGSINITGTSASTSVNQGNDGKILAYGTSNGGGNITIDTAGVSQGTGSEILAENTLTIKGATVRQVSDGKIHTNNGAITIENSTLELGATSELASALAMNITSSNVTQAQRSAIFTTSTLNIANSSEVHQGFRSSINGGTINVSGNSTVTQQYEGTIRAATALTMNGGQISQRDGGAIVSEGTLELATGSTIDQGDESSIYAQGNVTLARNASIVQDDASSITSAATITAESDSTITQGDDALLSANSMVLNGTVVQEKDSGIEGTGSVSVAGSITQEDGSWIDADYLDISGTATITQGDSSYIYGNNSLDIANATIRQENDALISSGNVLNISGMNTIVQGNDGRIFGQNGVNIASGTITQGNNGQIEAWTGENITLGGTVTQGNNGTIATTGGGALAFNAGTSVNQGNYGRLINSGTGTMNLNNVQINQGGTSQLRTEGDLNIGQSTSIVQGSGSQIRALGNISINQASISQAADSNILSGGNLSITNGASVTQRSGSSIVLGTNGKLVVDNANLHTGADGNIRTGYLGNANLTDEQKQLAGNSVELVNNAILELGAGTQITSYNPNTSVENDASAFHKIFISEDSELFSHGLMTFNNDWIDLQGTLASNPPTGMIQLTNNSRLYGTGTVVTQGGLVVSDGSTLAAGGNYGKDIGSLYVDGPLMITGSGVLEITVNGADYDFIEVNGDVMLAGQLVMDGLTQADLESGRTYTIIRNEGKGTISGKLTSDEWWYKITQQWSNNDNGTFNISLGREEDFFALHGGTFNQRAGGLMLDQVAVNEEWTGYFNAINAQLALGNVDVLDMVSGGVKANGMYLYRETPWRTAMNQYGWNAYGQTTLGYRGQSPCSPYQQQNRYCVNPCLQREIWATPYHTESEYKKDSNAKKYDASTTGFLAGINYRMTPQSVFGIVVGYGRPELEQGRDEIEMDDFLIGIQAGTMVTSKLELKGMVAVGFQQYSMKRFLSSDWLDINRDTWAKSDFDGNTLMTSIELARPIYFSNRTMLRPLIALETENAWQKSFSENGGGNFNLKYDKASYNQAYFRVGTSGEADMGLFALTGHAFYSYQFHGDTYSKTGAMLAASATNGGGFQSVRGIDLDRHFLNVGAGASMYLNPMKTGSLSVRYDAGISDKATTHYMSLGLSQKF